MFGSVKPFSSPITGDSNCAGRSLAKTPAFRAIVLAYIISANQRTIAGE